MQEKLFQKCTHLLYCSVLSLGGNVNTKREAEVLFWVSKDKSNSEIATVLGCSGGTVGKHLEHIYNKLRTHTRAGAVIVALERLGMLRQ